MRIQEFQKGKYDEYKRKILVQYFTVNKYRINIVLIMIDGKTPTVE